MCDYPASDFVLIPSDAVTFTRRTEDPKLAYVEKLCWMADIPIYRRGESFHAPISLVRARDLERAWEVLDSVGDDTPDDAPQFRQDPDGWAEFVDAHADYRANH